MGLYREHIDISVKSRTDRSVKITLQTVELI